MASGLASQEKQEVKNLIDPFTWEKNKRIITQEVHGIPGLGNFSYRKQLESDSQPELHCHLGMCEIHCVVKGHWSTSIVSGDEIRRYPLSGGEGLIIYPGEAHNSGPVQMGRFWGWTRRTPTCCADSIPNPGTGMSRCPSPVSPCFSRPSTCSPAESPCGGASACSI